MKRTRSTMTTSIRAIILLVITAGGVAAAQEAPQSQSRLRPPAVPLVTIDPYTSCWSFNDRLSDDWPKHWTGKTHGMAGLVRVDGKAYRFMGGPDVVREAAEQVSLNVRATSTEYQFNAG